MRIVLVNWAKIWDGASHGGGVNQYCQALALALAAPPHNHEVISLFGGTTFVNEPRGCFVRRHEDWMPEIGPSGGIRIFEVVNSPVIAPSLLQFPEPLGEIASPGGVLERVVGELFAALKPDVVHWNNAEGFSIGCVEAGRRAGARTIFSLHNYHTICPQVYLMQRHVETCYDYDNGHNCVGCVKPDRSPDEERAVRAAAYEKAWREERSKGLPAIADAWKEFRSAAAVPIKPLTAGLYYRRAKQAHDRIPPPAPPGHAVDLTRNGAALAPLRAGGKDDRGKTPQLLAELNPPKPRDPSSPELRPLENDVRPEPPSSKPPTDYARRRHAMVEMLNSCDRVLAVSDFVRRKFVAMGVREGVIDAMPIGSRINRVIALKPDLLFDPPPFDRAEPRPLRLHFMGYNHHYKGLGMFAETLEMLSAAHLRRLRLSVFALGGQSIEWMFRRLEPRLAGGVGGLQFSCGYGYHDIPWMLGGKDITIVPSVWWDNAPQTVFESLSCGVPVLGADIGGIPDFVKDGVNGRLFRANDRADLKRVLEELVEDPWQLERMRKNVRPTKSIEEHAVEMEALYAGAGRPLPV